MLWRKIVDALLMVEMPTEDQCPARCVRAAQHSRAGDELDRGESNRPLLGRSHLTLGVGRR